MLSGQCHEAFGRLDDFSGERPRGGDRRVFLAENLLPQGFAAVGVQRTALGVVPRRVAAVDKLPPTFVPRPKFDQRMHPKIQIVHGQVGPDVAHLLLPKPPTSFTSWWKASKRGS